MSGGTSQSSMRDTSDGAPINATVNGASLSRRTASGLSPATAEATCFQIPRLICYRYSRFFMKTEWVTFDCYGTLIDWDGGIRRFFSSVPGATPDMLDEWEEIQFHMVQGPYRRYRDILAASLRETLARRGLPAQPEAEAAFAESLPTWTPFPDTNAALERLKANGLKLGLVSNIDDDRS